MIKTRIIHYNKLLDRKQYLQPLVINDIWYNKINKDNLSIEIINKYYKSNIFEWNKRCHSIYQQAPNYKELRHGDISCNINHMLAWRDFFEQDNSEYGLFFEDDIILYDNFYDKLNEAIRIAPSFDALFIGGGFEHTIAPTIDSIVINNYTFITKGIPSTNCLCSYILTKNIAKFMYNYLIDNKFVLPIDFEVNYLFKIFNAKVIHLLPMLCFEGSSAGYYNSSQQR